MGTVNGWERPNWFKPINSDGSLDETHLTFKKPVWFEAVAHEVKTTTQSVALADLSALSKFQITGPQTQQYLNTLGTNKAPGLGRVGLSYVLTPAGGVQSEFSVSNFGESSAYLTSPSASERMDYDSLLIHAQHYQVQVQNVSADKTCIGIMGPSSRALLAELTETDLHSDFPWLQVKQITVAGIQVLVLRLSYVGELGYELHIDNESALQLLGSLQRTGEKYNVGYYGAYAANSMRIEKGYAAWSTELTSERSPEESGGAQFVNTDNRNFVGRDELINRRSDGAWRTVLVEIDIDQTDADGVQPFYAHPVFQGDQVVGVVASAAYGYRCEKYLAFALLKEHKITDNLSVEILGIKYKAQVLNAVPYDADNTNLTA